MRCYPLIDADTASIHKQPMFMATMNQIIRNRTRFYLVEEPRGHYRLHARQAHTLRDYLPYAIHCPKCGKAMRIEDAHIDEHVLARYTCPLCEG